MLRISRSSSPLLLVQDKEAPLGGRGGDGAHLLALSLQLWVTLGDSLCGSPSAGGRNGNP